eukprot:TRINITY_DN7386_c0_g1_i1.p1 TRINITY_DN7386_c0_g1~~TRINITY_DN7386_c0_g1_i1.p1  ORF type:complete len:228 (-),score=68.36 TRINITY_DN7386_c0_g1_i1:62-745(-)
MKHNYILPNAHFRKDWQRYVRTYFDQPAQKLKRRLARKEKAKAIAPRPLTKLRPVVRGCTLKYNTRVRAGRGFSLDELKAAGLHRRQAKQLGITVDHRRRNVSNEGFQVNVNRLKLYQSKLVVFPRRSGKEVKKGEATKEQRKAVTQVDLSKSMPITAVLPRIKARPITAADEYDAYKILHKARMDKKKWGAREKRAKDKKEGKKGKKKGGEEEKDKKAEEAPAADD